MAAKKVKVTYQDGREEIVKVLPRAQVMTEQHFSGFTSANALSATFHLGWAALQVAGKETTDFETWLNRVEDVEDFEEPVEPTPEVPSSGTSSESPS